MLSKILAMFVALAPVGAAAEQQVITDGMCASDLVTLSSADVSRSPQPIPDACARFVYDQVYSQIKAKGNLVNGKDTVWWKDTHGAFVIARCFAIEGKTLVFIASHHTAKEQACPAVNTVRNAIVKAVAGL